MIAVVDGMFGFDAVDTKIYAVGDVDGFYGGWVDGWEDGSRTST